MNFIKLIFLWILLAISPAFAAGDTVVHQHISDKYAHYHHHHLDTNKHKLHTLSIHPDSIPEDTLYYVYSHFYPSYLQVLDAKENVLYTDSMIPLGRQQAFRFQKEVNIGLIPLDASGVNQLLVWKHHFDTSAVRTYTKGEIYQYLYEKNHQLDFQLMINTLCLGFLCFVFIFFLFYSLLAKQKVFYLYVLYLFLALIYCLSSYNELPNHAKEVLAKINFIRNLNETTVAWMFIGYILFADSLLGISKQSPSIGKYFKITMYVLFVYGLFHIAKWVFGWSGNWVNQSYFIFRGIFLPVFLSFLVAIYIKVKSPLKPFLMIASGALLAGVIGSVFIHFKYNVLRFGENSLVYPGAILQIGIVFETICFSLALGYYNHLLRKESDEKIIMETRLSKQIHRLTLKSIATQMNPHFLFNGINAIRDLIYKDNKQAALTYINEFAQLLRSTILYSQKETSTLTQQFEHLKHYLAIEKLRLGDNFEFEIINEENIETDKVFLPSNLLQPVVENAIKQGLRPSNEKQKRITFTLKRNREAFVIEVLDNGIGLQQSQKVKLSDPLKNTGSGLKLVNEKIELYNQQKKGTMTFELIEEAASGTKAIFTIHPPKIEEHD